VDGAIFAWEILNSRLVQFAANLHVISRNMPRRRVRNDLAAHTSLGLPCMGRAAGFLLRLHRFNRPSTVARGELDCRALERGCDRRKRQVQRKPTISRRQVQFN
jgi:hypothetical protein